MVKVRYTLVNNSTNSVISGTMNVAGSSFHAICDNLGPIITAKIPQRLGHMTGEDPSDWVLLGFSDAKVVEERQKRAKENKESL